MRRTFRFALCLSGGVLASLCLLGAASGSESESGPVGVEVDKPATGNHYPVLDSTPFAPDTETGIPSYDLTRPVVERDPHDRLWEILGLLAGIGAVGGAAGAVSYSRSRSAGLPSRGEDRATAAVVDPIPVPSNELDYTPSAPLGELDPAFDPAALQQDQAAPLTVHNSGVSGFDPALDDPEPRAAKIGQFSEFDPGADPQFADVQPKMMVPASTVGDVKAALADEKPLSEDGTMIRLYKDRTWEVVGPDGQPISISYKWQHTYSPLEANGKKAYKVAVGGFVGSVPTMGLSGIAALFGGIAVGGIVGAATDSILPVPDSGETDVILTQVVSCKREPGEYNPIIGDYIYSNVLRYKTLAFSLSANGDITIDHDWQEETYVLDQTQDPNQFLWGQSDHA